MPLADLTPDEREIIRRSLDAAAHGPWFPEWEFHILFGLDREEVAEVFSRWPHLDEADPMVDTAINNSLANLMGYPHGDEAGVQRWVGASRWELYRVFERWRGRSGKRPRIVVARSSREPVPAPVPIWERPGGRLPVRVLRAARSS